MDFLDERSLNLLDYQFFTEMLFTKVKCMLSKEIHRGLCVMFERLNKAITYKILLQILED